MDLNLISVVCSKLIDQRANVWGKRFHGIESLWD
jgi:hypothetical protein